jgi:hypothetical protein
METSSKKDGFNFSEHETSYFAILIFIGNILTFFTCFYMLVANNDPILLIPLIASALLVYFIYRAMTKRMPRRIEISDNFVHLYDLPSFWVENNMLRFPLICRKCVTTTRNNFALEWINNKLMWNDLEKGRSVFLIHKMHASPLVFWLKQMGIHVPPPES